MTAAATRITGTSILPMRPAATAERAGRKASLQNAPSRSWSTSIPSSPRATWATTTRSAIMARTFCSRGATTATATPTSCSTKSRMTRPEGAARTRRSFRLFDCVPAMAQRRRSPACWLCRSPFLLRCFGRLADHLRDRVLDHRSFEEIGIHRGPQSRRIDERKIAKVLRRHQTVVNQFVRLFEHLAHIGYVPVPDIRTQHGVQPRAVRIHPPIECNRIQPVIRLAPEVEIRHEQVLDFLAAGDFAAPPLVQHRLVALPMTRRILGPVRRLRKLVDPPIVAVKLALDHFPAVALEQFAQFRKIEILRIELLDRIAIALAPMLHQ